MEQLPIKTGNTGQHLGIAHIILLRVVPNHPQFPRMAHQDLVAQFLQNPAHPTGVRTRLQSNQTGLHLGKELVNPRSGIAHLGALPHGARSIQYANRVNFVSHIHSNCVTYLHDRFPFCT